MKKTLLYFMALLASLTMDAVTFNVTVPPGTRACYISGAFNGWNAVQALKMTADAENHFTLDAPSLTAADVAAGFKYLCGPEWKYVEKSATGAEIGNRTVASDNDVVGAWAGDYDPSIIRTQVNIGGYERTLRIALPEGYETSGRSYPVVYLLGVQQRYSDAGSDNAGDDFFGSDSWNIAGRLKAQGCECIVAAMYAFVAECIPFENTDFAGSGATDAFLDEYISSVVAYVSDNYRVDKSPESTVIAGADLGALASLYAGAAHPECFGTCVAMSPMLWINSSEISDMLMAADSPVRFILSYGDKETASITAPLKELQAAMGTKAELLEFAGAYHNDISWGPSLAAVLPDVLEHRTLPSAPISVAAVSPAAPAMAPAAGYSFYYTQTGQEPAPDESVHFTGTPSYTLKNGSVVSADVLVKDISSSFTGTCYWNVWDNATAGFLNASASKVAFSSKKTAESWLRVVVLDDKSVENCAASSIGFRLVGADATVTMAPAPDHHATGTITFNGDDKTFRINYGSVNSQSDMGAVTAVCTVSADCLEAFVDYDFMLNSVTVTETKHGSTLGEVSVVEFSAVPAVTVAGRNTTVKLCLDCEPDCTPDVRVAYNYGTEKALSLAVCGHNIWTADIPDLEAGIYHLTLNVGNGSAEKRNIAAIAVKVLDSERFAATPKVGVNAYEGIDWGAVNQYKANFHTHTAQSFDTRIALHDVVDLYHQAGYSILALTDHDYNPYPWTMFDLFSPDAQSRDPRSLGMLAIPGIELSKDNTNSWSETAATGEFNHHNDFFTGRKGQEFATLRESYAYTCRLGGMQIINHPGQYWSLDRQYTPGEKNSPEWHAENFRMFPSLIGLEVYNQGNRRPNDRILWDQILEMTMPERPVWGYSCDDTHTREQYFRNYQYMLMPELTVEALKDAMGAGAQYFCYEYTGSGLGKTPRISDVRVDNANGRIELDTDADNVYWIYSTDKASSGAPGSRKSTVVGIGRSFDFSGYQGKYVRALLTNDFGETCTQPFGFTAGSTTALPVQAVEAPGVAVCPNPARDHTVVSAPDTIREVCLYSVDGTLVSRTQGHSAEVDIDMCGIPSGVYVAVVKCELYNKTIKIIKI